MSTAINNWILSKVTSYLRLREGCTVEKQDAASTVVQDSFGFRYQVTVTMIGRSYFDTGDKALALAKETMDLDDWGAQ